MCGAMLSKSLTQFSIDGWGCIPSLLFDLRPNYGGGNEDNGDLLQKVLCIHWSTQCPQPYSRPPPTHASTGDSWTLTGKTGPVSCGSLLLSPGSWCTRGFVCSLQESVSPVLCKFCWLYGGVNDDLLQEGLCRTPVCCTQSPCPCSRSLLTCTSTGDTQTQYWLSLCGGLWILGHKSLVLTLRASLVGMGLHSKCDFAPPTILLGLLLCPWMWGIFFK